MSMSVSIADRVRRIASDVFETPLTTLDDERTFDLLPNYDSLRHLNFLLAVEQDFGIAFQPEEMAEMLSISLVAMLVGEQKARSASNG